MLDQVRATLPARPAARRLLLGILLSSVGQGMTLPFLYVYLTRVRHLDPSVVGGVVAWMGLLSLLLAGPGGALIDRFGVRRVVLPLYAVDAVGVASYGFVHSTWQAFGSATLSALGGAVLWSAQNTLMSTVTDERERQRVFGVAFALLNLGIGAGGVIAGFVADTHRASSFRLLYLLNGLALLAPLIVLLTLPSVGHRIASATSSEVRAAGYREVFANVAFRRFLLFAVLITVCGYAQIEIGFPAFASTVGRVSPRTIALALAANTATIVLAQMLVLKRMTGRSRSRGLAVVGTLIAASWLILGLGCWGGHPALATAGTVVCAVVFATGETVMSPVMPAITNALATEELRGRFNAMSSMIWGGTAVVGPLTAAPLIGHGLGGVWIVLVVAGSLGAAAVAVSLRRLLTPVEDGRAVPVDAADRSDADRA